MEDMQSGMVAVVDSYIHRIRNLEPEPLVAVMVPTEEQPEHIGADISPKALS